jgi:PAS domain S-box-containing protein
MSLSRTPLTILLIEDDTDLAKFLRAMLMAADASLALARTQRLEQALDRLAQTAFDVILLDLGLEDSAGIDILVTLYRRAPATPIVVLTDHDDEELGALMLQHGAQDYLVKGQMDGPMLLRSMRYAIERKHAAEALRAAEVRFRTLVEHLPAITYIAALDDSSSTLYTSPQIETLLGFSQAEWMADHQLWFRQVHPDDRLRVLADLERSRASGAPVPSEYRVLTRDGDVRWFRDIGAIVRDEAGLPLFLQGVMFDITERKHVEDALRESETRFRSAFDDAAIGMALVGLDGRWLQVNHSVCEILGYAEEEMLETTFQAITHPDDLEVDLAYVRRLLDGEIRSYQMEKRYFHKYGHIVWVLLSVSLVRGAGGEPLYFISQIQDITARKRAEQALLESEKRYRTLVENLPLSVYEIDRDGRLLSMNRAGLGMIGAPDLAQVDGQAYLDIVPHAAQAQLASLIARAFAGEILEIAYTGVVESQPRMYRSTLLPLAGPDDVVDTLVGTTEDITEQVQARLEAELERDRLDAVLESSNDAIIMVDLENRVVLVNRAFCTFFGVEADQILGVAGARLLEERWDRFEQPEDFLRTIEALAADPQREASAELILLRPARRMLVWYSRSVRDRMEAILGRLFIFRDATREKEADLLKTEFISIVSHELRTPLTSIKGFTDLILDGDAGEIAPQVREFLEIVKSSADQLVEITDDILETSRIEAGKLRLSPQPLTLADVAQTVAVSIQMLIAPKEQTLTLNLPPDLPQIFADRERLVQIIINLLSNAHKYTPAQGQITLCARLTDDPADAQLASTGSPGPWVIVSIIDTGIGIAPEDQQHLFGRFYRVSSPETHGIGGTGLGLHITRSLVELHGGAIWVESEPGRGSTFSFSLPIAGRAQSVALSSLPAASDERLAVLVVEPDVALARLIRRHLERADYRVVVAGSGGEALQVIGEVQPALITLAIDLPDLDGEALIERLRAAEQTADLPVIVIAAIEDADRALPLGVDGYLSTPIEERALLDIVQATLAQDRRSIALVVDDDPQIAQALARLLAGRGYNAFTAADGQQALTLATRLHPRLVVLDLWMPGLSGFQVLNVLRQHPAIYAVPVIALNDSDISPAAIGQVLTLGATDLVTKPADLAALETLIAARLDALVAPATDMTDDSNKRA